MKEVDSIFHSLYGHGVTVYFDNIVIYTNGDRQRHLALLEEVLTRIIKWKLVIRFVKCSFCEPSIVCFGWELKNGLRTPAPSIKEAFWQLQEPPTTKKQAVSALAALNYIANTIPGYALMAARWQKRLEGRTIHWMAAEASEWWHFIRWALERVPVAIWKSGSPTRLTTDWSAAAISGILEQYQVNSGEWVIVVCVGRGCSVAETAYNSYKGELLALVWSMKRLGSLLRNKQFLVRSDCAGLVYLQRNHPPEAMVVCWINSIAEFNFVVEHINGVKNVVADYLSRQNVPIKEVLPIIKIDNWRQWSMVDCTLWEDYLSKVYVRVAMTLEDIEWFFVPKTS